MMLGGEKITSEKIITLSFQKLKAKFAVVKSELIPSILNNKEQIIAQISVVTVEIINIVGPSNNASTTSPLPKGDNENKWIRSSSSYDCLCC